jgi:hypothetical protein
MSCSEIPSPIRRSTLVVKIKRLGATAIVACTLCACAWACCIFSSNSVKYSECTRKGVSCDGNFVEADFDKLSKEKARLEAARTRAIEETASLNRRIKALYKA